MARWAMAMGTALGYPAMVKPLVATVISPEKRAAASRAVMSLSSSALQRIRSCIHDSLEKFFLPVRQRIPGAQAYKKPPAYQVPAGCFRTKKNP